MNKMACICMAIVVAAGIQIFSAIPAYAQEKGIGTLESVNGPISMKSLGSYGVYVREGMPVYHGDKFVTAGDSSLRVSFHDGSVLEIRPNTVVRIAVNFVEEKIVTQQSPGKKTYHFRPKIRREIRVFIGKIKFGYGKAKAGESQIRTLLVSPKAACELNGGEAWFGFDGNGTSKDQAEGTSEIFGDVHETGVPDISATQLAEDPTYKAALVAINSWKVYENAKKDHEIVRIQSDQNAYTIMSRTDKARAVGQIEEDWQASGSTQQSYLNLVGKLSAYSKSSCMEVMAENLSLKGHWDTTISQRAVIGLSESESALEKVDEGLSRYDVMKKNIHNWIKKRNDAIGQKRNSRSFDLLVVTTLECMSAYEKYALVGMLTAETYTSGIRNMESEVRNLGSISKECKINAEIYYNKTRIYINTALTAAKDDTADSYLVFGEVASDIATANAAAVNLVVTCLETTLTDYDRCRKYNTKTSMDELWQSVEAKDNLTGLEEKLETNYKSEGTISVDKENINQIMINLESSAKLCAVYFYKCMERISIVLSLKPEENCPMNAPFRCEDGSCVTEPRLCGCPPELIRCWDDTCVEDPGLCPCPNDKPFVCEDGTCVRDLSMCPCPALTPIRCFDGKCVREHEECFDTPPPIDDRKPVSPI